MKLQNLIEDTILESNSDFEIQDIENLDQILSKLVSMIERGQSSNPNYFGLVAACVLDPNRKIVARLNCPDKNGRRIHAERAAMTAYYNLYGEIPQGSTIITTLSPCSDAMEDRAGDSCTDLINQSPIHKVYCGYIDPTQTKNNTRQFTLQETNSIELREKCKNIADKFLDNYRDNIVDSDNKTTSVEDFKEILKKFLPLARKIVKLDKMPKIILKKTLSHGDQPTMGRFHNDTFTLELAVANRQPVDILRTLAHELTHARQNLNHVQIDPTTGSNEENEANAMAGVVMRHFNKEYPEYLSYQPVTEGFNHGRKCF